MLSLRKPSGSPLARAVAPVLVLALLASLVPAPAWASRTQDLTQALPLIDPVRTSRTVLAVCVIVAIKRSPVTIDADGNRVRTTTTLAGQPTATVDYLVDTSAGLSQVVAESTAAGVTAYYTRGDDLLSVIRGTGTRFYHADGLGSIRKLTNETGTVTDSYMYSAFGEQLSHTSSDPQPYSFAGEPYDPNVGFQYHRARWMDPRVGRLLGQDPFGGDTFDPRTLHRYLYVAANPANDVDPSGTMAMPPELEIGRNAHRLISLFYRSLGALIDTGERAAGGFGGSRWRTDIAFIKDAGIAGGRTLFPGTRGEIYEIKSLRQARLGFASADLAFYIGELRKSVPATNWREGDSIIPMPPTWPGAFVHPSLKDTVMHVSLVAPGEIAYEFVPLPYDPEESLTRGLIDGVLKAGIATSVASLFLSTEVGLAAAVGF